MKGQKIATDCWCLTFDKAQVHEGDEGTVIVFVSPSDMADLCHKREAEELFELISAPGISVGFDARELEEFTQQQIEREIGEYEIKAKGGL